jgi:hypothetical protein
LRFDEFTLRVPGEEFRLRFHEQLTVLAGVGPSERMALIDSILGAMTGAADDTVLSCTDHTGRAIEVTTLGGRAHVRFLDDGSSAPAPIGWFAPDAASLRRLIVMGADDLGLAPGAKDRPEDTAEITEARATLRELSAQLSGAEEARQRVAQAKAALDDLDGRIRIAETNAARNEYAQALGRLERVRAEARVLDGGDQGAAVDRRLLEAAPEIDAVAARWHEAAAAAALARGEGVDGIDPVELGRWASVPQAPPVELKSLLAQVAADEAAVGRLEQELRDLATATMPAPDDRRVLVLATADQRVLWEIHRRLVWAEEAVEREMVALGGVGTASGGTDPTPTIDELEAAHRRIEEIDAELDQRRPVVLTVVVVMVVAALLALDGTGFLALGLVLAAAGLAWAGLVPMNRQRAVAVADEAAVLARLNVPSYMAFHLRRVDAALDPTSQDRLEVARAEAAQARKSWDSIAGSTDPAVATALEADVKAYAAALRERGGAVDELAQIHRRLEKDAQPALRQARAAVVAALRPYGLGWDDVAGLGPADVAELVGVRIALGAAARGQRAVVDAEAEEEKLAGRLAELLNQAGITDGPLDDRLAAIIWARTQATEREATRQAGRARDAIQVDLAALEADVRRLERPEFGIVRPAEAGEPDIDTLLAERQRLHARLAVDEPKVDDLDRIADRHAAMERRVTALVQANGAGDAESLADLADIQERLLAHLTLASHVGPRSEPVPVVLDEPFVRVPAERKWELMDMLCRLAERTQLLYVTDDAFIGAWARRRADAGALLLLEPVE